ncbi:MAG: hypothetical protein MJ123_11580 [Lachnospiraceae bacterium]|nr:hypothetical protein [Lachnospiraceae bacterium]
MLTEYSNPFKITTPEGLSAEEAVKLFVDVFSDFYNVMDPGNVLIKGPRGVGKSMMLRFLEPDCQCLHKKAKIGDLPFIAVYVPLKNTTFTIAELQYFADKHAYELLNEHLMILHCLVKVFECLQNKNIVSDIDADKLSLFYKQDFLRILELKDDTEIAKDSSCIISHIITKLDELYKKVLKYLKRCSFSNTLEPYSGELFDYNYYFVPLISCLSKTITNLETPPTFYLMLDDAHYLSETQTKILNSWIASRVTMTVSLKVSTQYNYKNYLTLNGTTIDTPHDYIDVDVATIYTATRDTYYKRITSIVERRLKLIGVDVAPSDYFPPDFAQEEAIKRIEEEYINRYDRGEGKGANRTDDARRYARPDFIKELSGPRKSSYTYSYAGFDQLVNISSGVVRTFLHLAHEMYAKQLSFLDDSTRDKPIDHIDASIQTDVVRTYANSILYTDIEKYSISSSEGAYPKADIDKLANLIKGLGALFRVILISNRSERRVFSIAISDIPSSEVLRILDIGVRLGYFHKTTIGRKESGSIGRTHLYVLNRMLAPVWTLDPNGFAGYLFIRNSIVEELISNPLKTVEKLNKRIISSDSDLENQLSIFDLLSEPKTDNEVAVYGKNECE